MKRKQPPPPNLSQLVRVSTPALREMVLATVEAYQLARDKKNRATEIYGHIWGHQRFLNDLVVYSVESVSVSSSSIGTHGTVDPNPKALALKQAVMDRWYPQLTLLGDFHSHPYDSLAEVMRPDKKDPQSKGFEFSESDFKSFSRDDVIWEAAGGSPLMLVMTICKLGSVREGYEANVRRNVQSFTIGEFRFWINGSAGYTIERAGRMPKRFVTPDRNSTLLMDVFPAAYNRARDRLIEESTLDEY